ncbi:hypothetical protein ZYGR_0S01730 [Zygosaccharomyces rouxii]|uniref:ZYRO0F06336p n=2 Tax=Zygosaccharomyces rouxii TaxID=4956 RepID=C5DXM9_ZYGRC|nr:uncharacterized protein ZYRO0F06336g [Zygosaccharomyces rouxii]GAV50039.1 hypothetical protein ZYGR_0S01730 [Zygosaccharomyces rouxii]CAR28540.1 ZYRO0F06336p [Zygosaccharomyces rouxii]
MGNGMDIPTIDVNIRVKTQQVIKEDQSSCMGELPVRRWRVELCMLNEKDEEVVLDIVSICIFYLHPTFKEPVRKFRQPPFVLEEEGWGEFDMEIVCHFIENVGKFTINHLLSFEHSAVAIDYAIKVPCHTPLIREYLSRNFTLPDANFDKKQEKTISQSQLRNWINLIPKLDEDSVTEIVQLILRHPAVQAEVNKQERHDDFLMGLYQLPNELLQTIGDYILHGNDEKEF